jgi:hypothetical protein
MSLLPTTIVLLSFFTPTVLLPATKPVAFLFVGLPLVLLCLPLFLVLFAAAVAFLTLNGTFGLVLTLLFTVECVSLDVASASAECAGHLVKLRLFRKSDTMGVG